VGFGTTVGIVCADCGYLRVCGQRAVWKISSIKRVFFVLLTIGQKGGFILCVLKLIFCHVFLTSILSLFFSIVIWDIKRG